jgi:hypothetical protein
MRNYFPAGSIEVARAPATGHPNTKKKSFWQISSWRKFFLAVLSEKKRLTNLTQLESKQAKP